MTVYIQETNSLSHIGVLGMKWGRRKTGVGTTIASDGVILKDHNGKAMVISKEYRTKSGRLAVQYGGKEKKTLGEKVAAAYGITKKNGNTLIGLDTIPKIAATAFVAKFAFGVVAQNVLPKVAWSLGKVISNSAL